MIRGRVHMYCVCETKTKIKNKQTKTINDAAWSGWCVSLYVVALFILIASNKQCSILQTVSLSCTSLEVFSFFFLFYPLSFLPCILQYYSSLLTSIEISFLRRLPSSSFHRNCFIKESIVTIGLATPKLFDKQTQGRTSQHAQETRGWGEPWQWKWFASWEGS